MNLSILIASYGGREWADLARGRALPTAEAQGCEVLIGHQSDGTCATSRNGLAERATGAWLCFLDADDELAPGFMGAMQRALEREETPPSPSLLLTPAVAYVRKGKASNPIFHKEIDLRHANWLIIGTLIERDLFFTIGGFREWPHGLEDWDLWTRAWKHGVKIVKVRQAVYRAHWNQHSKHRILFRQRGVQPYWHQKVGHDVWPEIYEPTTPREDAKKMLLHGMRPASHLRFRAVA